MRDFLQRELLAEFLRHGCDRLRLNPTGNNQIKITEFGIHVQGEPVRSDSARDVDADGGDFTFAGVPISPDSRKSGDALCRDPKICTSSDQNFFKPPHVLDRAQSLSRAVNGETTKIEDGIRDELTWSMESNVTATVAFEDFNSALGEQFRGSKDILRFSIPSQRNHWRVLEQQKNIADEAIFAQIDKSLLQLQTSGVIHDVELDD